MGIFIAGLSIAALALGACLTSCSASSGTEGTGGASNEAPSQTRTVVDMQGNNVEVPHVINNAFDGYPVNVGVIAMLGAADTMEYGLPRLQSANWAWLRELAPNIADLKSIGDDAKASAEEVLSINPDVVIVSNKDTAAEYLEAGLKVFTVTSKNVDEFLESVKKTGELFGESTANKADEFVSYYKSNIEFVQNRIASIPEDERPTVYYVGGTTAYKTSISGNGIEFITNAGGRFALSASDLGESKEVTAEQLLAANPDVIIVGTNNRAKGYASLMEDSALSSLSTIQNGLVYKTPQGTLPWDTFGPEQSMAVLWMAKTLYPDLFSDIDLVAEMKSFYEKFYGYELSDETAELMLNGVMGPDSK